MRRIWLYAALAAVVLTIAVDYLLLPPRGTLGAASAAVGLLVLVTVNIVIGVLLLVVAVLAIKKLR
ncbi:MAG: hypothetical protein IT307_14845 [Chloroflexi bacterium]|nr:hypothetical protein [Chloroflexota bacterium]